MNAGGGIGGMRLHARPCEGLNNQYNDLLIVVVVRSGAVRVPLPCPLAAQAGKEAITDFTVVDLDDLVRNGTIMKNNHESIVGRHWYGKILILFQSISGSCQLSYTI